MAWNQAKDVDQPAEMSRKKCHAKTITIALAIAFGFCCAVAIWLLLTPANEAKETTTSARTKVIKVVPPVLTNAVSVVTTNRDPHAGLRLASNGVWQPANRPYRAGATKMHDEVTNRIHRTGAVKSGTDQILLSVFSRAPGDMPMPLPATLPKKDLDRMAEILLDKHEEKEGDSDLAKFNKETLRLAKAELRTYLKNGGTIEDFIKHYHDELVRSYHARTDAQRYVAKAYRDGEDPHVVSEMVKTINGKLKAQGVKKIHDPTGLDKLNQGVLK